jgi:hypothetical protein
MVKIEIKEDTLQLIRDIKKEFWFIIPPLSDDTIVFMALKRELSHIKAKTKGVLTLSKIKNKEILKGK